ncbi:MAG: T9SS C-terminal target domain-containing protein [Bacteroidetes bacterium]|nr:T9SS C-terminal target domain-containing protein [Bacteroidota bacterium]
MCKFKFVAVVFCSVVASCAAQYAPAVGIPGTTAMHKDSSLFVGWATNCTIQPGFQDISSVSLGYAAAGDSSFAVGVAGANATVSLGDGGAATVTFMQPIFNGQGFDFAVFENSFSDSFLELAFVEVSSDGTNYFRFPSHSLTDTTTQVGTFGTLDPTKINNLAGKYRAMYGTPFDLEELPDTNLLDKNSITHVRIVDVVGSVNAMYASYDSYGNKVNDPWPTPFPSGGFDLDAVGVIHQKGTGLFDSNANEVIVIEIRNSQIAINLKDENSYVQVVLTDVLAREIYSFVFYDTSFIEIPLSTLVSGINCITVISDKDIVTKKINLN